MPILYVYRCKICRSVQEIEKPYGVFDVPAPLCTSGHGPMARAFTPLDIRIKNGTPKFHGPFDRGQHAEEFQEEQHKAQNEEAECAALREESQKNYYSNGLHHAHGFGSPEDDMAAGKELRAKEALMGAESK